MVAASCDPAWASQTEIGNKNDKLEEAVFQCQDQIFNSPGPAPLAARNKKPNLDGLLVLGCWRCLQLRCEFAEFVCSGPHGASIDFVNVDRVRNVSQHRDG